MLWLGSQSCKHQTDRNLELCAGQQGEGGVLRTDGFACLHRGTRTDPGCGLTGEHPGSAHVQVKCQEIVEGFLHMLVEARVKHDKGQRGI